MTIIHLLKLLQLKTAHHHNFQLTFMTLLGLYVTYLLYLALRAFGELRAMNFIESRLKFHCATLVVVFSLLLSIMSNRYGRGVLEDNFIAQVHTWMQFGSRTTWKNVDVFPAGLHLLPE